MSCRQEPRRKLASQSGVLHSSTPAEAISNMCFAFLSKCTVHLGWGCHLNKWRCLSVMCFHCSRGLFTNYWLRLLRVGILHDPHCKSFKLEIILPSTNAGEWFLHFFKCFIYGYFSSTASISAGMKNSIFVIISSFSLQLSSLFALCCSLWTTFSPQEGTYPIAWIILVSAISS